MLHMRPALRSTLSTQRRQRSIRETEPAQVGTRPAICKFCTRRCLHSANARQDLRARIARTQPADTVALRASQPYLRLLPAPTSARSIAEPPRA